MALRSSTHLANPRAALFFGIYTSLAVAILAVALLIDQLGASTLLVNRGVFVAFVILFVLFGLAVRTSETHDFFTAGRRAPAIVAGSATAFTALGGVGLVTLTGALFIMGTDAFAILLGLPLGLAFMAVLLTPYLRKFGANTLPEYLGTRFESTAVRIAAAAILAVPLLLLLVAELRLAGQLSARLVALPFPLVCIVLAGIVLLTLIGGGVRSLTWSGAAKAVAIIGGILVPVTIAAVHLANVPIPQITTGNVARSVLRIEIARSVPLLQAAPWLVDLPGQELEALGRRFLQMFGSVGGSAFSLVVLASAMGIAGLSSVVARTQTTRSVLDSRAAMGWAAVVAVFVILTMTAVAVHLRFYVTEQVLAQNADRLPGWFQLLIQQGLASTGTKGSAPVSLAAIQFDRDGVFAALPIAMGLPSGFVAVSLFGCIAACLLAAAAHAMTLAVSISDDILLGNQRRAIASRTHLMVARASLVAVIVVATALAQLPADPLQLFMWALTISASASFPVLALSVLWKRLTAIGALGGLLAGAAGAIGLIVSTEMGLLTVAAPLPAVLAAPTAWLFAIGLSLVSPAVSRQELELLRDMRVPGGETLMDRRRRLDRMKQGN